MFLKQLDLTTAFRPAYLPDEVNIFVQDAVGLYQGKFKIPDLQYGQVYLTTHRICYVDKENPRKNSVAIELRDVDRCEFYAGFMKSSAKITLVPKPAKLSNKLSQSTTSLRSGTISPKSRAENQFQLPSADTTPKTQGTWICPICSLSNPVPPGFDLATVTEYTPLAPCLACGIKPPFTRVLKAAIANATNSSAVENVPTRPSLNSATSKSQSKADRVLGIVSDNTATTNNKVDTVRDASSSHCPRCTFLNHPSLPACELCGASLKPQDLHRIVEDLDLRAESPGPVLGGTSVAGAGDHESIKLSFRAGGDKTFHERLKGCMVQRKWLLQDAPPVPKANTSASTSSANAASTGTRTSLGGIAGLEQRRLDLRKNNEVVIGNAFEDLEALMDSAKEIVALAESFAASNGASSAESQSVANALGLATTKDMLGNSSGSDTLYTSELARNLAEFLTDDARGVLRKAGGIITLVDLWAMFNRARGGVELVSPADFEKAARLWEDLKLPVRLRQFKTGVLVVQGSDWTSEKAIKSIAVWLQDFHLVAPDKMMLWDWRMFGQGVTVQDAADRFGWSIGVAEEELEMAVEAEALCREASPEGTKYWENWLLR